MTTQWISALLLMLALVASAPLALANAAPPGPVAKIDTGMVTAVDVEMLELTVDRRMYKVPSSLGEALEEVDVGDGVDVYYTGDREVVDIQVHDGR
jgi:hypothetical protein